MPLTRKEARARIEERIAAEDLLPEEAMLVRAGSMRAFEERRAQRVAGLVAQQAAFEERGGIPAKVLAGGRNALLGAADSVTLGRGPELINLVSPDTAGRVEESLDAAAQGGTRSFLGGQIGGFFTPGSAPARVTQGFSKAGAKATGTGRLVEGTLESGLARRFGAQLINNAATGGAAVVGTELTRGRDDSGGIGARLTDAFESVSPTTTQGQVELGLNVAAAAFTAPFSSRIAPHLDRAVRNLERRTGHQLPVDTITDRAGLQRYYDAIGRSPGADRVAEDVRRGVWKDLLHNLDEIAAENGLVRRGNSATAAAAVRDISGVGRTAGRVTQRRRAVQRAVLEDVGPVDRLGQIGTRNLRGSLDGIFAEMKRKGELPDAPQAKAIINRLRGNTKAGKDGLFTEMSLEQLESVRRRLSDLQAVKGTMKAGDISSADDAAIRKIYGVLQEAMASASPRYKRVLEETATLRRVEEALGVDKIVGRLDDDTMQVFWGARDRAEKWKAIREFAAPEEQNAIKGWLLGSFLDRVASSETGIITPKRLAQVLRSKGEFNRQNMEQVFGKEFIREMMDHAAISESFIKGIGRAEGSDTASRLAVGATIAAGSGGAITFLHGMLNNNWSTSGNVLGAAGVAAAINLVLRSSIQGTIQNQLQALARSAPQGVSRLPGAIVFTPEQMERRRGDRFDSKIRAAR